MSASLKKVIDIIDEIAPFSLAEEWDNPGLQIGSPDMDISKILVALDPTMETLKMAVSVNSQLIITHHPLLFHSISHIDLKSFPGNFINEAIKNNISVIAAHTNLDNAKMGINQILAIKLGLTDWEILEPKGLNGMAGYGIGIIGYLGEPVDLYSYAMKVKECLNTKTVRVTGPDDVRIRCVASVGGSGRDYIAKAKEKGADLIVTGDIGHHDALNARALGINVIDAGHFYTERAALTGFIDQIRERLETQGIDIMVELYKGEADPVRIL
ncbi:MAG: Nif3-like dinuclear metal center hexameric protein [Desulfatiglans sp.]|jgi:dinuclear metal center YbgI/SA1388 family protein|nr:Nif3-like dinuclear metal center hexameric protein [Desulfatiglans sp.]